MADGNEDQARARLAKGLALWAVGGAAFVAAPWLIRRKVRPQVAPDGPVVGLRFDNGEGIVLAADLYAAERESLVIVAHGFTSSKNAPEIVQVARRLSETWDVLALDLRGHGQSGGAYDLGLQSVVRDVAAAVGLARSLRYRRIALMGFSLGAAACVMCAAEGAAVDAVVSVACPAAPLRDPGWMRFSGPLWRGWARFMGTRVAVGGRWDRFPLDAVGQVRAPILIVHDGRDALIPKEMSEALFAAAGEPKQYLYLAGVPHAQLNGTGLGEVRRWLAGVMDAE